MSGAARGGGAFVSSPNNIHVVCRTFVFRDSIAVTLNELSHEEAGIGASTFDAAVALGAWLVQNRGVVRGKSVLELGAGTGLVGCVCAGVGAANVLLTDVNSSDVVAAGAGPMLFSNLEANVCSNSHGDGVLSCVPFEWGGELQGRAEGSFDVVVGSDLYYSASSIAPLCSAVRKYLKPGGCFLSLSPTGRTGEEELMARMMTVGNVELIEHQVDQCQVRSPGEDDVFCMPVAQQSERAIRELAQSPGASLSQEQRDEVVHGGLGLRHGQTMIMMVMTKHAG
mmetsp:Transcript_42445/g.98214  ORF Transcript_42445/g.98214 Transcript_42445/m.98214 type:complete len:282 (-) Transcript_42445:65-910(-)